MTLFKIYLLSIDLPSFALLFPRLSTPRKPIYASHRLHHHRYSFEMGNGGELQELFMCHLYSEIDNSKYADQIYCSFYSLTILFYCYCLPPSFASSTKKKVAIEKLSIVLREQCETLRKLLV